MKSISVMGKKKTFFQRLVTFLFGETIVVEHAFFGKLIDAGNYYEGEKFFASINKPLEFGLEKTTTEFEKKQMTFFRNLDENYDQLIVSIAPAIEKGVAEWLNGYRVQDFKKEFILVHLWIPGFREENPEWKISFYADNDLQHWCHLEMKGMNVIEMMIDG